MTNALRAWPGRYARVALKCSHRGVLGIAFAALTVCLLFASPAQAEFGFKTIEAGFSEAGGLNAGQAGSHPIAWKVSLAMKTKPGPGGNNLPDGSLKNLRIRFPRGLVAAPAQLPRCSQLDFSAEECPAEAAVGTVAVTTDRPEEGEEAPLFNLVPQIGSPAEFGFVALQVPVRVKVSLSPDPPFDLVASISNVSQVDSFFGAELRIEGAAGETPLLTLPRRCDGPLKTIFEADSWQQPGVSAPPAVAETPGGADPALGLSGCDQLLFDPTVDAKPTIAVARATSGLDFTLDAPDPGLASAAGIARADLEEIAITLPEGMTVNAAMAAGLDACSRAEYGREALGGPPGAGCPEAAKIGTAAITTPLLEEPVPGSVYVAQPDDPATLSPGAENPFDSLLALYLVLENPKLGVLTKLAMKVDADPATGRLTAAIEEIPQLPISRFELHLWDGPRSPLRTPPACGAGAIRYRLTPSSGAAPLSGESRFVLDGGCGAPGFSPTLAAGSDVARAGAATSFQLGLSRADSEENLSGLSLSLPPGVSANLGAIPLCPSQGAAAGACPPGSRVGSAHVVAGTGSAPLRIPAAGSPPGAVYLAGAYEGAPFSLAVVVPAQAGPFDLGTVTLRAPIFVDRRTAQASIRLDGLPQLLEGIPIDYRSIRVALDRPGFVRNPTSCAASTIQGSALSSAGQRAPVANRFQVGGCGALRFRPRLSLRLLGPTHRSGHPGLRAVVRARPGDANLGRVTATLPPTELLDSRGIESVCSHESFVASDCPATSVRGRAKVWTPLLDQPLVGPVYLRSSTGKLPDLVASLRGAVAIDLVAGVDSTRGRLRLSVRGLPDVPLSKVVLTLGGGKNGLLVNSGGVCSRPHRVATTFAGKNGKRHRAAPALQTSCHKR